ncbi:MAG: 23S rRNA (guanosine(2251)-2'-O)-methyltransferase RlmB [Gammaproteobacteria bacterium]|nr:23S rRNA (guanosine(2251)-2'-O)-methyltransferase RlmB [Gammaproteobacteria bacterium]MDH3449771.1 23S rRNA (guanosine(2251)-2'-O)-methyltransferase RlmB [Gammaproteobacteria bacterium]
MSTSFVYGVHAVSRRLSQAPRQCVELICVDRPGSRLRKLIDEARKAGIVTRVETRAELTERSGTDKHQGCLLKTIESDSALSFDDCLKTIDADSLLLVLDGLQDPHNLGACLRTADACGVDAVIIPKDRSVKMNATVRKVAAGGAESVPLIEVTNITRSLKQLKQAGVWIYGTSETAAKSLYDLEYRGPVALVMGAEGAGLRRLTMDSCDHLVKLPMLGQVESLNVSVATGVCLYEILRSRNAGKK